MRLLCLAALLAARACAAPADSTPLPEAFSNAKAGNAVDDGTYLERVDPLGGQWRIDRIGSEDFTRFGAWVNFSAGGFLSHGAGCSGGYPAFYRLDGERLTFTRREDIRIGKCGPAAAAERAAAAESERRLAAFLDQAAAWSRPDGNTLVLIAKDGTRAVLARPGEPHPELAGRWLIETIGGAPLVTERRPPTVIIAMSSIGAFADYNSMGGQFTIPAPGKIVVSGPIVSTAIGCQPEDAAEDDLMMRAITMASGYRIGDDRLVFSGGPGMVLRRPPQSNRQLGGEYEACGNTLLGAYHEGPITLAVDERTMRDNAGCTASYSAQGPHLSLRLEDGPACADAAPPFVPGEPVGIGGEISTLAVARPDGFGFDDEGRLILRTERGLLTMCRVGSPPPFGN